MKQLTQKLKDGRMEVLDVPPPMLGPGMVLVRNSYSLISAGTEGSTVRAARRGLIGKAIERPQQVKQVLDVARQQGPIQAYRAVTKKLDAYSALGYSSAGTVIETAPDVKGFNTGDLVACAGGGYASHAEVVAVPENLCVKLPPDADIKGAAFNTLGAIALQGLRQADLRLGESCVVIGLGLLGQLSCLLLRASGVRVAGVDIDLQMVEKARTHCADVAFVSGEMGLEEGLMEFAGGMGADAVIIAAASESLEPVNLAGRLLRKKGRVVIVGDVPTGFDREPDYYRKELELRMSCSYGPGRYDTNYEEKGLDYPIGYVRWTENRNMQAFQELLHSGRISMDHLATHVFELERSPEAYDMIVEGKARFLGVLIQYPSASVAEPVEKRVATGKSRTEGKVELSFIGAGSYAMGNLFPNLPKSTDVVLRGVMSSSGTSSRTAADKFGFEFCTADENDIFNEKTNTVFIATRHDSHASYVLKSLRAGKHVYVEKPLCIKPDDLDEIREEYLKSGVSLMVGFNRRFSPLAVELKHRMGNGTMAMLYRINAGHISPDSWIQDPEVGGGRIVGEVCHFIDFLTFVNGSLPVSLHAVTLGERTDKEDTLSVNLKFENGSIGSIAYYSNGSKSLYKEHIEVYRAGTSAALRDFKELEVFGGGKTFRKKLLSQNKGQKAMLDAFVQTVRWGGEPPISFEEIYAATLATFKALESIRSGQAVRLA